MGRGKIDKEWEGRMGKGGDRQKEREKNTEFYPRSLPSAKVHSVTASLLLALLPCLAGSQHSTLQSSCAGTVNTLKL